MDNQSDNRQLDAHSLHELKLLEHVSTTPTLSNREAARVLGVSVKLAHQILTRMAGKGWFHITKHHARRWDYFLTPTGLREKGRLTLEFLDFSMQFYREARRRSASLCRHLAETGRRRVAFLGAGELAEITEIGVREWGLSLAVIYADSADSSFLGAPVRPVAGMADSTEDAIIVCLYDPARPTSPHYLPANLPVSGRLCWIFDHPPPAEVKSER